MIRLLPIFLFACSEVPEKTDPSTEGQIYCNNSAECGDGQLCFENLCIDADCFTSEECLIGEYCDDQYQCVSGCNTDIDCFAGELCDLESNACVAYGCRNTELDCSVGEYCDTTTGSCYEDGFGHCQSCSYSEWQTGIASGECVVYSYDENSACQWDDWTQSGTGCDTSSVCLPNYLLDPLNFSGGFCAQIYKFKTCQTSSEEACPRGFTCYMDIYQDGSNTNDKNHMW